MTAPERFASHVRVVILGAVLLTGLDASMLLWHRASAVLLPHEWGLVVAGVLASNLLAMTVLVGVVTLFLWRFGFEAEVDQEERDVAVKRTRAFTSTLALFAAAAFGWALTSGRQASQIPMRPLWVLAFALVAGLLAWGALWLHVVLRERRGPGGRAVLALLATMGSAAAEFANATILIRNYPVFHLALSALTILLALVAADALFAGRPVRMPQMWTFLMLSAGALCAVCLAKVVRMPEIHFALEENAPVAGQIARRWPVRYPDRPVQRSWQRVDEVVADVAHEGSVDLRGRSVLLITVDALRWDVLRKHGGRELMPNVEALASAGVVFDRAYTSTPHTSYAITGILTGAFVRLGMETEGDGARPHETLADVLGGHGIRTAAFYPPAVFYVDQHRFRAYESTYLGFATHEVGFASGSERVRQLRAYLESHPDRAPMFAWVHLFEPHEPYEPPAEFHSGDSPRELYDGEVRAADAAIGQLVRVFREAYPNAIAVITSDHGEEFDDHGGQFHGTTLYDEQARVPLIWSSPDSVPPHAVSTPVQNIDIAPTLLAALGVPQPMRMHASDLSTLLASGAPTESRVAFASLEVREAAMLFDGEWKVVCRARHEFCALFNLLLDPREGLDVSRREPDTADRLTTRLYALIEDLSQRDLDAADATAFVLAQAELGNRRIAERLVPLLGSDVAATRARAARYLGEFAHEPSKAVLASMRTSDPDPEVRGEALLATLRLNDADAAPLVASLVRESAGEEADSVIRRGAMLLAQRSNAAGGAVLLRLAEDAHEESQLRADALVLTGVLRVRGARPVLERLLTDLTLRTAAATALGALGDRRAVPALRTALAVERYPAARAAEEAALRELGARPH